MSDHYYLRDGTGFFDVPNKSKPGTTRPVTITDAKKAGALPSVTTILRVLAKGDGLMSWIKQQIVLEALTMPDLERAPRDGESMADVAKRIITASEEQSAKARELGTNVHNAAEEYARRKYRTTDPALVPILAPYYDWFDSTVTEVIGVEHRVIGANYAGTIDLVCMTDRGLTVIDIKTQAVKKNVAAYNEWLYQLAAYSMALDGAPAVSISNVVINTLAPPLCKEHVWSAEDWADGVKAFEACLTLWQIEKGYAP